MEVKLYGLQAVQQALREAPRRVVALSFAKALDKASGVIEADVATRAEALNETDTDTPIYEHVKVQVEVDTEGRGGRAAVGFDSSPDARTGKPQDAKALWVEYGHEMKTHDRKTPEKTPYVFAKPFMRPAFEATADRAVLVFAETLAQEIDK